MSYSYDRRDNGVYLLTGEKHKDKDIVIKMGSVLKEEQVVDALTRSSYTIKWTIEESEDDSKLAIKAKIDGENHYFSISKDLTARQLVNMVKKSLTIESCTLIREAMYKGYNIIFHKFLDDKGILLASSNIVSGYATIRHKGKVIGTASRFVFTQGSLLYLCEYVGKSINKESEVTVSISTENTLIKYRIRSSVKNTHVLYDATNEALGYLEYEANIYNITTNEEECPNIAPLKVSKTYLDSERMLNYCRDNNTTEEISAYKISLKPRVEIIDVNKFMLREFTV